MTWKVSMTASVFRACFFRGVGAEGPGPGLDSRLPWCAGGLEAARGSGGEGTREVPPLLLRHHHWCAASDADRGGLPSLGGWRTVSPAPMAGSPHPWPPLFSCLYLITFGCVGNHGQNDPQSRLSNQHAHYTIFTLKSICDFQENAQPLWKCLLDFV